MADYVGIGRMNTSKWKGCADTIRAKQRRRGEMDYASSEMPALTESAMRIRRYVISSSFNIQKYASDFCMLRGNKEQ